MSVSGGTTIGGANSSKKTDVTSLEYCTFRVPYEELNMIFRNGQKDLDRSANQVSKAAALLTQKLENASEPIKKDQVRKNIDFLLKQVREAKKNFSNSCTAQLEQIDKMIHRADVITEELEVDPMTEPRKAEKLERYRHARYIVWHLLRCGYVKTAREMVDEMEMEKVVDVDVFEKIYAVEQALLARDTKPCLEWIDLHRSKLRRLGSRLEIVVRQKDAVELIEEGKVPEAVQYVRKFLAPIAKGPHPEDLKQTMGAIACTLEESRSRNPELHAEDRWEKCAEFFIAEVYRVYEIYGNTALSILLQCGIAAFKTPSCHPDYSMPPEKIKCFVCRPDIWPLAEKLPFAHVANSRILCSMTDELCDDDENIPYLFPSGHVFGLKAIEELRRADGKIWDPVHRRLMNESEALRLYFL